MEDKQEQKNKDDRLGKYLTIAFYNANIDMNPRMFRYTESGSIELVYDVTVSPFGEPDWRGIGTVTIPRINAFANDFALGDDVPTSDFIVLGNDL